MARNAEADAEEHGAGGPRTKLIGLVLGLTIAAAILIAPRPADLPQNGWIVIALAALMVTWWVSEAVPIAVTALLPLAVLPAAGVVSMREAAAPYADPILYLFIGGFMLGVAVEKWRLHERIALNVVVRARGRPRAMVAGFMLAAALISMWISNTATTLMLAPIAYGAARAANPDGEADIVLGGALMLGLAHASTIGGVVMPVGSPTNLVAIEFFARAGHDVDFASWALAAAPMALIMLPLAWLLVTAPVPPRPIDESDRIHKSLRGRLAELGGMSQPEGRIAAVFGLVAFAWMFRPLLNLTPGLSTLSDAGIALFGAIALFLIPSGRAAGERLLDWPTAERIPWGIVIMFGGGLSLAAAMEATDLTHWIGGRIAGMDWVTVAGLIAALVAATIIVSELASNVATLTSMLPIAAAIAAATGVDLKTLGFPMAIAASFAFMLPVATPPNAIAYATGLVTLRRMLIVGACLNIAAFFLIISVTRVLGLGLN